MNEWSPAEFYSGSMTTDQPPPTAVYRQYWEENWTQARINTNLKNTMNGYKIRDYQQQSMIAAPNFISEDVGIPPYVSTRKKKNGVSDPRFKRVINPDVSRGVCSDVNSRKMMNMENINQVLNERMNEETTLTGKVISYLKAPAEASLFMSPSVKKFDNEDETALKQEFSEVVTKDVDFEASRKRTPAVEESMVQVTELNFAEMPNFECFGEFEKTKNNHSHSNVKRSASECTLHTKNTVGDENENESGQQKPKPYPSATRLNKVQNWIKDYKDPAEKRRSVITVIGQTQNQPFSKILNEINQRRKLAKELDKHALCKAIMESPDTHADVKNLIAKVDFVLPDGKVIYSTEKVYLHKNNSKYHIGKENEERGHKDVDSIAVNGEKLRKRCEMIPERDSPICQGIKRTKIKRSSRKLGASVKEKVDFNDNIKSYYAIASPFLFWPFLVFLCLMLCVYAYYFKFRSSYSFFLSDFLRPKHRAWYKKILL